MENNHNAKLGSGDGGGGAKSNTDTISDGDQLENPNLNRSDEPQQQEEEDSAAGSLDMAQSPPAVARASSRTPFTNLSQVDADLALARTLQEQVRPFFFSSGSFLFRVMVVCSLCLLGFYFISLARLFIFIFFG